MSEPRIIALQIEDSSNHFHMINYKKDLVIKLQKTIEFGVPGLLTKAMFFADEAKTIPVMDVVREYDIQPVTGKLLRKKTKRVYYCEDGSVHPEVKDGGWYTYTSEESRAATHRRRVNITNKLESDMLALLVGMAGSDQTQVAQNLQGGAAFMNALSPAISAFHLSGSTQAIIDYVSDEVNQALFPFLNATVAPGVAAYQFIIAGVSY